MSSRLEAVRASAVKRYGASYVRVDGQKFELNVVPFGSWMLDYKSGIGGAPFGHAIEVFGANKLGKSSAIAYPLMGNLQRMYLPWRKGPRGVPNGLPALIASEPRLVTPQDQEWARRLGLDPDGVHILYPDHIEEAADMLREMVFKDQVDYIVIDSLGGLGTPSGAKADGKQKAYGISGAVTSMLNDIMPRIYRNNIGLMIINQQRQSGSFNGTTLYDSPGGEALHHHMRMRMQVKPGAARFHATIDDEKVLVGRELTCKFIKNNMCEGSEKSAAFNFYHIATEEFGFGVDRVQDIINVGKLTGVLKGGGWLEHPTFPATKSGEHKLNGKDAVAAFIKENPKALEQIRQEVLEAMVREDKAEGAEIRAKQAKAKVTESDDE